MSKARSVNMLCVVAPWHSAGATSKIIVIDNDQGESGASASWRQGFQRQVTDVGMGQAGIVMGLEVSRLARNNGDWHRLPEICALTDTLILDEDGVYDPASFNDRLLLGLNRPDS
jgi:DNA invertase Pin-like site-specific DNA recombinase